MASPRDGELLVFKETYIVERMGLFTIITLGEGMNLLKEWSLTIGIVGLGSAINSVVIGFIGWTALNVGLAACGLLILVMPAQYAS